MIYVTYVFGCDFCPSTSVVTVDNPATPVSRVKPRGWGTIVRSSPKRLPNQHQCPACVASSKLPVAM